MKKKPPINAIAPWYGGNRKLAEHVGEALDGCEWAGIPFAGGMAEIAFIRAREIVANDLHRGVVNMAKFFGEATALDLESATLVLRTRLLHPDVLAEAQATLEKPAGKDQLLDQYLRAVAYFVLVWMTRSGTAGTDAEGNAKLCLRWSASGGGSATRYQSAVDSIPHWVQEFRRCTFSTLDVFEFLKKCKDKPRHGIYCDPPFPGPGDKYTHKFTETQHRALAQWLSGFKHCRVVVRFYDHPLIREIYGDGRWEWRHYVGRDQANNDKPEILLINSGFTAHNQEVIAA